MAHRGSGVALAAAVALLAATAAPAGATIAYEKGAGTAHPSIWVAADDGAGAHRLARGDSPRIAPDGSAVLYAAPRAAGAPSLAVAPAAGGAPRTLATGLLNAIWSPDSRTIAAILGGGTGAARLVLLDVASGAQREVARGFFQGMSFAPDGSALAYDRAASARSFPPRSEIYAAPVAGGAAVRLTRGHRSALPVWGPDRIALVRYRKPSRREDAPKTDVYAMRPDGSGLRRLTHEHPPFLISGPSPLQWSADGLRLLGQVGGQDTLYGIAISPRNGRVRTLARTRSVEAGFVPAALSRDGRTVLGATGGFDPGARHDVATVPYRGGRPHVVVRNAFNPSWTG